MNMRNTVYSMTYMMTNTTDSVNAPQDARAAYDLSQLSPSYKYLLLTKELYHATS